MKKVEPKITKSTRYVCFTDTSMRISLAKPQTLARGSACEGLALTNLNRISRLQVKECLFCFILQCEHLHLVLQIISKHNIT